MISDMNEKTFYTKEMAEFFKSLKIQLRVIYALLMREIITRYGRHNLGFAWLFLEPMIFTLGVAVLWTALKASSHNEISIATFAVTGYSTIILWRNSSNRVMNAVDANSGLLFHRNVKVLDLFLARIFLEVAGTTMSFLFLCIIFILIGWTKFPADFLLVVKGWFLLIWFTIGLSLVVGSLAQLSEIVDRLWHAVTYLLFPLSGAAYMVYWLPPVFREYVLWLPMVHNTEMIRHGFYGDAIPTFENTSYLIWCNLTLTVFGLVLARYSSKRIEVN